MDDVEPDGLLGAGPAAGPDRPVSVRPLTPEEQVLAEWLARREDEPVEAWEDEGSPGTADGPLTLDSPAD